jgi:1-acyl-sn-glycerol-3-phosphate acyltransferase
MPFDQTPALHPALPDWHDLHGRDLWRWPLGALASPLDRLLLRAASALARRQVQSVEHWERVLPDLDPFILVANHGSRRETVYLTAALMLARGGRPVHFLGDWNFRLIPGVGYLYAKTGAITVTRKDARPRILNRFKPLFVAQTPALEQARARLRAGRSIALFPEGTINRDPHRLLRGRFGAARLSLETGVPVVPVGIRFLGSPGDGRRADCGRPMGIYIGAPLTPPQDAVGSADQPPPGAAVRAWHGEIMTAIAALSGKTWCAAAAPQASPAAEPFLYPTTEPHAIRPGGPPC